MGLRARHGERLERRVSLDHHTRAVREAERGPDSFEPACEGVARRAGNGFRIAVAGRRCAGEPKGEARAGYAALFERLGLALGVNDLERLVLFPGAHPSADISQTTKACRGIPGRDLGSVTYAGSFMVDKRRGIANPVVIACTVAPHDPGFEFGHRLAAVQGVVGAEPPQLRALLRARWSQLRRQLILAQIHQLDAACRARSLPGSSSSAASRRIARSALEASDLKQRPPFRILSPQDGREVIAEDVETEVAARLRFASAVDLCKAGDGSKHHRVELPAGDDVLAVWSPTDARVAK